MADIGKAHLFRPDFEKHEFECSALMRETLEEYPDKKSKRQSKRIRNLVAKNNKYRGRRLSSLKIYNRKKLNRDAIFQGIRDTDHLGES